MFQSNIYWTKILIFGIILIFAINYTDATQSVYSCPLEVFGSGVGLQSNALFAPRLGYPGGITDM